MHARMSFKPLPYQLWGELGRAVFCEYCNQLCIWQPQLAQHSVHRVRVESDYWGACCPPQRPTGGGPILISPTPTPVVDSSSSSASVALPSPTTLIEPQDSDNIWPYILLGAASGAAVLTLCCVILCGIVAIYSGEQLAMPWYGVAVKKEADGLAAADSLAEKFEEYPRL